MQVLEAEPRMVAMPGNTAGIGLTVDHEHRPDSGGGQLAGGGQACRSRPHDEDRRVAHRGARVNVPGSTPVSVATSATTSAPQ